MFDQTEEKIERETSDYIPLHILLTSRKGQAINGNLERSQQKEETAPPGNLSFPKEDKKNSIIIPAPFSFNYFFSNYFMMTSQMKYESTI